MRCVRELTGIEVSYCLVPHRRYSFCCRKVRATFLPLQALRWHARGARLSAFPIKAPVPHFCFSVGLLGHFHGLIPTTSFLSLAVALSMSTSASSCRSPGPQHSQGRTSLPVHCEFHAQNIIPHLGRPLSLRPRKSPQAHVRRGPPAQASLASRDAVIGPFTARRKRARGPYLVNESGPRERRRREGAWVDAEVGDSLELKVEGVGTGEGVDSRRL